MSNIQKGKYGENLAAGYLKENKYQIIDKNYKYSRYGEIDIIALSPDKELCFVEVKTRTGSKFGSPMEAITKNKLLKIFTCMKNYLAKTEFKYKRARIDAISIELNQTPPKITHIKNVELS